MKMVMRLLFFFTCISSSAYARFLFPAGCEATGFRYSGNYLVLNPAGGQTFYLLQNKSNDLIEMRHVEQEDTFMSPPLIAKLHSNNWAAFAADVQDIHFQCFVLQEGKKEPFDCQEILEVCQYPLVKFALSNMGNYWVSVDKPREEIIKDAVSKGIWLRQRPTPRNLPKKRHH
jgi:hypothetical protein